MRFLGALSSRSRLRLFPYALHAGSLVDSARLALPTLLSSRPAAPEWPTKRRARANLITIQVFTRHDHGAFRELSLKDRRLPSIGDAEFDTMGREFSVLIQRPNGTPTRPGYLRWGKVDLRLRLDAITVWTRIVSQGRTLGIRPERSRARSGLSRWLLPFLVPS